MQTSHRKLIALNVALVLLLSLLFPYTAIAADPVYTISVGGKVFNSDTNASGTGWKYESSWHALTLDGYNGTGIRASGDLRIYCSSNSTITGSNGNTYASDGITISGALTMYVYKDVSVTVKGGNATYAGDSIDATAFYAYGTGKYTLRGGTGSTGGTGVRFRSACSFGTVFANIYGGSGYNAFVSVNGNNWTYSPHTTVSGSGSSITITPNRYRLTLKGYPGHVPGGSSTSLTFTDYYPAGYFLDDYVFERDGYVQVTWSTSSSLYPLNAFYTPSTNVTLSADWISISQGDILLNGLSGKIDSNSYYRKYNTSVTLPKSLHFTYSDSNVLAWGTELQPVFDATKPCPGEWYTPETTVNPGSKPIVLYAWGQDGGTFAAFKPTSGKVRQGGNILVVGTTSTSTSLKAYAPDATYLIAPNGYYLTGWSKAANGSTVDYGCGETVSVNAGAWQYLYATWAKGDKSVSPTNGVVVGLDSTEKTVRVNLSENWCKASGMQIGMAALYNDGRMICCRSQVHAAGNGMTLEIPYSGSVPSECKIFLLNTSYAPVTKSITIQLRNL